MKMMDIIEPVFLSLEMNGTNLISYLAEHGNVEEVEKLFEYGGKPEDAAYGYAMARDKLHLHELLEKCPKSKLDACIGSAIRAYARIGSLDDIYEIPDFRKYKTDLLVGFAQSGVQTKVTPMLERDISLFSQAVEGYARCNQGMLLSKLIRGTSLYPLAIYNAALSGHTSLVNDLLAQCGINQTTLLRDRRTNLATASKADINTYSLLNSALKGYLTGRHFNDAVRLLECGASIGLCVLDLKSGNGFPSHELYFAFLAHINDPKLSESVLDMMANQALVLNSLEMTTADKEKLNQIRTFMNEYNLNYVEACLRVARVSCAKTKGDITLPYLAEVVKSELTASPSEHSDGFSL